MNAMQRESNRPAAAAAPRLRVLHVLDNLGMGGGETWLMELLRYWRKQGPEAPQLEFLATGGAPSYYDREAEALGAKIHYLRFGRSNLAAFTRGFRKVLGRGYAAVHDHGDYSSGWHYLLGGGALPPVRVTHIHSSAYFIRHKFGTSPSRRLAIRVGKMLVGRYATHILGTSRQVITEYGFDDGGFAGIPKVALYCGFDASPVSDIERVRAEVRREFGWPLDASIILVAGRIDPSPDMGHPENQKNSGFAVSVGIAAARSDQRIHMLLAGAISPAVPALQARVEEAGLAGRVRFAGIRNDLKRLMYAADVLLFPSRGEGLGMVAVEAQAAGLPVLASTAVPQECAVVPDLVRFEPVDKGAAEWASMLLEHAARPRDYAEANALVAQSPFAIEHSASTLLDIYRQARSS